MLLLLLSLNNFTYSQIFSVKYKQVNTGSLLWWNGYDGLKTGVFVKSDFNKTDRNIEARIWYNTGLFQDNQFRLGYDDKYDKFGYNISYLFPVKKFINGTNVFLLVKHTDGFNERKIEVKKQIGETLTLSIGFKSLYRTDTSGFFYLLYPDEWGSTQTSDNFQTEYNNTINGVIEWKKPYGDLKLAFRTSMFTSDYKYSSINATFRKKIQTKKLCIKTRAYIQFGFGDEWAKESLLYLAGSNQEEMLNNPFTRSVGFIPYNWLTYGITSNHFQSGGGLNLRGYAGYLAVYTTNNDEYIIYRGKTGASLNVELEFDQIFEIKPEILKKWLKLNTYFFGDIGIINYNDFASSTDFTDIRSDAGVGAAFSTKAAGIFKNIKPVTIRFDFPLFLSHPPAIDQDYLKYRWLIGVNRAF